MISSMPNGVVRYRLGLILAVLLTISGAGKSLYAQTQPCSNIANIQSVSISSTSGASTRLVNSTDAEKITYICSFHVTMVGAASANTILVQYGTGATCGTGTTTLTGAFTASTTAGAITNLTLNPALLKVPVANSTCILTTTADAVKGVMTYEIR